MAVAGDDAIASRRLRHAPATPATLSMLRPRGRVPAPGAGRGRLAASTAAATPAGAVHTSLAAATPALPAAPDVVVIGSGIGGLTAGALLARYGFKTIVLEAHDRPGGAAHGFDLPGGHRMDAGPSFFAGLAAGGGVSSNPLRQALDALGETVPCASYDRWITHLPGTAPFAVRADGHAFRAMVAQQGGPTASSEWARVETLMAPLAAGAASFPAAALRGDPGVLVTLARFGPALLKAGLAAGALTAPFGALTRRAGVTDPWLAAWLDLECFVLSGMLAKDTICAEMAFMFGERGGGDKPSLSRLPLDYPLGGSTALVDALVRGLTKHGGHLVLNTRADSILVEGGRAAGVAAVPARRGATPPTPARLAAAKAVVSNASVWDTARLLPGGRGPVAAVRAVGRERERASATRPLPSFLHLHASFDATGLPAGGVEHGHHLVVNAFTAGAAIEAPQNVVIAAFPAAFDPSLSPPGTASVHAYTAGNEPYELWEGLDRESDAYKALKEERSRCLFAAVARAVPDFRDRLTTAWVGTPTTHARFLNRHRGSYGPGISAATSSFPGPSTLLPGLLRCGDSTAPGIGVPAAAASGMIAANTLAPVWDHLELMRAAGL
jgi:phytoene dehydrogenase-like protein